MCEIHTGIRRLWQTDFEEYGKKNIKYVSSFSHILYAENTVLIC